MRILVARFSAMGDVAMAIPVITRLAEANPTVSFTFVTKPGMTRLWGDSLPANLTVRGIKLPGSAWGDLRALRALVKEQRPDALVDLHDVLRSRLLGLLCRLGGARVLRFDKARAAKRAIIRGKSHGAISPTWKRYADAFRPLPLIIPPFPQEKEQAEAHSARAAAPAGRPLHVGIAPYAAHQPKEYPAPLMRELLALLQARGARISIFTSAAELPRLHTELAPLPPGTDCVASRSLGLQGELKLMRSLDVMIAMDSGNMHLSALAQVPTVSIWGATSPRLGFTAFPSAPAARLTPQPAACPAHPCSTFGRKTCPHARRCLCSITPAAIMEAVDALTAPR